GDELDARARCVFERDEAPAPGQRAKLQAVGAHRGPPRVHREDGDRENDHDRKHGEAEELWSVTEPAERGCRDPEYGAEERRVAPGRGITFDESHLYAHGSIPS